MPDTPKRKRILDNLATVFGGMAPPTYFTIVDPANVNRTFEELADYPAEWCPGVAFFASNASPSAITEAGCTETTLLVSVFGFIAADNETDRRDRLWEFEDDLHRVIMRDQSRGGAAVRTTITSTFVSEPDTDEETVGVIVIDAEVTFEREVL